VPRSQVVVSGSAPHGTPLTIESISSVVIALRLSPARHPAHVMEAPSWAKPLSGARERLHDGGHHAHPPTLGPAPAG
jgi:hypothetical protein